MVNAADPLWMQTFTGKAFRFPVQVDALDLLDIAHALAHQCRYNGHVQVFYSVAEHSVLMARWFAAQGRLELAKGALFHDAGEAYVSDVPRPLKPRVPAFGDLSDEVDVAIAARFGVDLHAREIKDADWRILSDEKAALMAPAPEPWVLHPSGGLGVKICGWSPEQAKREFLETYNELFLAKPRPRALPECCKARPDDHPGKVLYATYNAAGDPATAGLNFQGKPCPVWDELPENVRAKWTAVALRAAAPSKPAPPTAATWTWLRGLAVWAWLLGAQPKKEPTP